MTNLVIDSGAFSAWNTGKEVDIDAYGNWLLDKVDLLWHYYSLDAIPGSREQGGNPTKRQINQASKLGWKNYLKLRKMGLNPVPVFHQFEDFEWLDRYMELGLDLIGISPNKAVPVKDRAQWCNHFFRYVTQGSPFPARKFHGLGISGPGLVYRFPWYSIDTTAPLLGAGRAEIATPHVRLDRSIDWERALTWISITERKEGGRNHVADMPLAVRENIAEYVARRGESMAKLTSSRCIRARFNFGIFREQFSKRKTPKFKPYGFASIPGGYQGADEPVSEHVRLIAAVNTSRCDNSGLTQLGFHDRLISYVFIKSWNRDKLSRYVKNGIGPPGEGFPEMTEACLDPPKFKTTRPRLKT